MSKRTHEENESYQFDTRRKLNEVERREYAKGKREYLRRCPKCYRTGQAFETKTYKTGDRAIKHIRFCRWCRIIFNALTNETMKVE